jgi:hypothetical protein
LITVVWAMYDIGMQHDEACKALNIPVSTEQQDTNPLRVAVSYEFNQRDDRPLGGSKTKPGYKDYRDRAIARCIKSKVSFQSEYNYPQEFGRTIDPSSLSRLSQEYR